MSLRPKFNKFEYLKNIYKQALISKDEQTIKYCSIIMDEYNALKCDDSSNQFILNFFGLLKQKYYKDIEFIRFINKFI